MLPIAVLCGGLGTRMRPQTLIVPKVLLDVAGEPFLAHVLRRLASQGASEVVLLVGYHGEMIERFAGDGSRLGLHVTYSSDGAQALGTAGAIRAALPLLGERFLMTFGDAYLPISLPTVEAAFLASQKLGLMTIYQPLPGVQPNVAARGGFVTRYDKQADPAQGLDLVDYGVCAFHAEAFASVPTGEPCDLGLVNCALIARRELAALFVAEPAFEIGTPRRLAETEAYLLGVEARPPATQ